MIHVFLVDYRDTGEYFKFITKGNKDQIQEYLMQFSHDVRFVESREITSRDKRRGRVIPGGMIIACKEHYDKLSTFHPRWSKAEKDVRHHVL